MTTLERPLDSTIDLITPAAEQPPSDERPSDERPPDETRRPARRPSGRPRPVPGMRIRRVRLRSVAKIASVFFALGYLTVVGTLVVLWNVALALGFVETVEDTVTTALGLEERFSVVGAELFSLVAVGAALLMLAGLLLTVLLALVYNVACALFGGLAIETGPLRREHRLASWRGHRFVTVRS